MTEAWWQAEPAHSPEVERLVAAARGAIVLAELGMLATPGVARRLAERKVIELYEALAPFERPAKGDEPR